MFETKSAIERPWKRQRLRVPRDNGALFARPPLGQCVNAISRNAAALETSTLDIQGRSLAHMRKWSRRWLIERARDYTAGLTGTPLSEADDATLAQPIVLGGHQPSLFHAGVWVKNFAIHHLAERCGGSSVNLVVDNDAVSSSSIRVPAGDRERPRIEMMAFDRERTAEPWEDAAVADRALFASFGERVENAMSAWAIQPVISTMWPDVVEQLQKTGSLRDAFTAGRCRLEHRWGLRNLELPLSRVCESDPFLWFAGHLFAHADRFREVHNAVLEDYRAVNKIRSRTHPVPELVESNGWLESPFWVFREDTAERGRLMVRSVGQEVHLALGNETFARLPLTPQMDACCAVEVLRELPSRGIRIRTRALTTTLFSRLCFGDLFVHGIGGAKYDEMTDRIITRFFRIDAPEFLTLSATLQLPLAQPYAATERELSEFVSKRRDLIHNPDQFLDVAPGVECEPLIEEKQHLIAEQAAAGRLTQLSRSERRRRSDDNFHRYRRLREINERLAECTQAKQRELEQNIERLQHELAVNAVLLDREFPFCLFPETKLRELMRAVETELC